MSHPSHVKKGMPYGECVFVDLCRILVAESRAHTVRLGKSGLKISRVILGCMSYGSKDWQDWVLEEDEALEHIKAA